MPCFRSVLSFLSLNSFILFLFPFFFPSLSCRTNTTCVWWRPTLLTRISHSTSRSAMISSTRPDCEAAMSSSTGECLYAACPIDFLQVSVVFGRSWIRVRNIFQSVTSSDDFLCLPFQFIVHYHSFVIFQHSSHEPFNNLRTSLLWAKFCEAVCQCDCNQSADDREKQKMHTRTYKTLARDRAQLTARVLCNQILLSERD